jgi:hypothetical protein
MGYPHVLRHINTDQGSGLAKATKLHRGLSVCIAHDYSPSSSARLRPALLFNVNIGELDGRQRHRPRSGLIKYLTPAKRHAHRPGSLVSMISTGTKPLDVLRVPVPRNCNLYPSSASRIASAEPSARAPSKPACRSSDFLELLPNPYGENRLPL